MFTATTSKTLF